MADVTSFTAPADSGLRRVTSGRLSGTDVQVVFNKDAMYYLLVALAGPTGKYLVSKAVTAERVAKRLCAVDTGVLRASISHTIDIDREGLFAVVGTNVYYAEYVEFGTRFMAAQPFLRPALEYIKGV